MNSIAEMRKDLEWCKKNEIKIVKISIENFEKMLTYFEANEEWHKLWEQDCDGDLEDSEALVKAVNKLDAARKALG